LLALTILVSASADDMKQFFQISLTCLNYNE
jgi:hypothetical protein